MRYAIGVDLGGTHIKAASVSDTGEVLGRAGDTTRDAATALPPRWFPPSAPWSRLVANAARRPWVGVGARLAARTALDRGHAVTAAGLQGLTGPAP